MAVVVIEMAQVRIMYSLQSSLCYDEMVAPLSDVCCRNKVFFHRGRYYGSPSTFGLEQIRDEKHYAVGHQGSLNKSCQNISGVVFVIRHTGQAGVERHHDECKLGQGAQQAGAVPVETRLQVKHQVKHGVHGERCMSREERLPGLCDFVLWPLALIISDVSQGAVDGGEVRFAHVQEVRAHAAH